MRALITGGAGFIGSHLADRLLATGHQVAVIDDLSTGSMHNIEHLKGNPDFIYYIDSIFNQRLLAELVDCAEVVFHLAAAVGVRRIIEFPVQTIETNVKGAEAILHLAAKKQKRVMIASTSEVYGKSSKIPFAETDNVVLGSSYNSRWGYACSKLVDEFLALAYFRAHKLPVTVVRLFNTAGPRQTGHYGMVVPNFVNQAVSGAPLTVFGSGDQSRCFSHVADILDGLLACTFAANTAGEIFNLGTSEEISIRGLAERVIKLSGSKSTIQYIPYNEAYAEGFEDMQRRVPDIARAKECFGYSPKRSLDDIINDVIAYARTGAPQLTTAAKT